MSQTELKEKNVSILQVSQQIGKIFVAFQDKLLISDQFRTQNLHIQSVVTKHPTL